MTLGPRILRLGEVRIADKTFTFTPASPLVFEARGREEVDFALPYHFEEGSPEREPCVLSSRLDLSRRALAESLVEIRDQRILHDEVHGRCCIARASPSAASCTGPSACA